MQWPVSLLWRSHSAELWMLCPYYPAPITSVLQQQLSSHDVQPVEWHHVEFLCTLPDVLAWNSRLPERLQPRSPASGTPMQPFYSCKLAKVYRMRSHPTSPVGPRPSAAVGGLSMDYADESMCVMSPSILTPQEHLTLQGRSTSPQRLGSQEEAVISHSQPLQDHHDPVNPKCLLTGKGRNSRKGTRWLVSNLPCFSRNMYFRKKNWRLFYFYFKSVCNHHRIPTQIRRCLQDLNLQTAQESLLGLFGKRLAQKPMQHRNLM